MSKRAAVPLKIGDAVISLMSSNIMTVKKIETTFIREEKDKVKIQVTCDYRDTGHQKQTIVVPIEQLFILFPCNYTPED